LFRGTDGEAWFWEVGAAMMKDLSRRVECELRVTIVRFLQAEVSNIGWSRRTDVWFYKIAFEKKESG